MIKGYQKIGNIIGIKNEYGSTRLLVDNSWSFVVPQGFTYTTDTTPIKQSGGIDLSGRGDSCYVVLRHGGDYDPDIEFCLKDNSGYGSVEETRNDDSAETGYASCVSYQIPCDEGDFIVGVGVYGMPLFNTLIMGCFRIRVRYKKHRSYDFEVWDIGDNLEDAKMYARELVNSIRVEDRDLSSKPGEVGEGEEATPDLSDFFLHALNAGGVANIKYDNEYSVASDNVLERKGKKLLRYNGSDTAIIIPEGFTSIGSDAFAHGENNYHIHGIVIPEGVTKLDEDCMALCASLTEVKLPSTLKKIGSGAFQYSGIEEVNIPDHVESIGDYAFFHCRSLKHLIIPESVKSIGEEAFDFMGVPLMGEQTEKTIIELPQHLYDDKKQYEKFYTDTAVFKPYQIGKYTNNTKSKSKKHNEQLDEVRDALKDLDEQAAQYDNTYLSDEDRKKLNEMKDQISNLHDELEQGTNKFSDYFDQKEERERKEKEERKRKIAEAKAKGKSEDDEVNMFVILTNEEKMGHKNRKQDDFYKIYKDDFPVYNKKDTLALRKKVKSAMKDNEYVENCRESFMSRSVEDRFTVSTKNYFSVTDVPDFEMKADEALERTKEWYAAAELPEVNKLMDDKLASIKDDITGQLQSIEPEWTNWRTAKKYLKVRLVYRWGTENIEIQDSCSLFQYERRFCAEWDSDGMDIVVDVFLSTEGMVKMTATVLNAMPFYWGVSYEDIWKAAIRNEIVDEVDADRKCNYLATDSLKEIKKKYPDAKTLKEQERAAKKSSSTKFVKDIKLLYFNAEHNDDYKVSKADIKKIIDNNFKSPDELLDCGSYILKGIDKTRMAVLYDLVENEVDAQKLYKEIPMKLSGDVNAVYEKSKIERQEKERKERIDKAKKAVASAKESIEQLGNNIKENTEKLADLNAELDNKHAELEKAHEKYDSFLESEKEKWRVKSNELKEDIADSKLYIEKLQEQISEKKQELSTLSFLQFGKKKELTQIIEGLTKEVQQEQTNRDQMVEKRNTAEKEYHNRMYGPQNEINNIVSYIPSLKERITSLTDQIESDKKALEEKNKKLPDLEKELEKLEAESQ